MTSYERPGEDQRPAVGHFLGYDHITILASNAKQVADWYAIRFGFDIVAHKGLETGTRDMASFVLKKNKVLIVVTCPLTPEQNEYTRNIAISGDHIHDVSFAVADCEALYEKAIERGAISVFEPKTLKDEDGEVIVCKIKTYGNVNHTLIQRKVNGVEYKGIFMPGFVPFNHTDPVCKLLPETHLQYIDHIVGNQPADQMNSIVDFYARVFDTHRFWSVDDSQICSEYSALRSIVIADFDENIKFPVNEPVPPTETKKGKSQIQEFVEYHGIESGIGGTIIGQGGAGVQHVALNTDNIIEAIPALRARGVEFLRVPKTYYTDLRERLKKSPVNITVDLDKIEENFILVDFDDSGYLLQLFTRNLQPRPTYFIEIIQRFNHQGFGVGNFSALFNAIEAEQKLRGNL
jgi:4-hydroxyphenylpyruvate dioxygenase